VENIMKAIGNFEKE